MAGITASVSTVEEIMPPTIGAAMRLMTSDPVPVPHMMGRRPAMMAVTVIIFGRTRSTAPSITAAYKSALAGRRPDVDALYAAVMEGAVERVRPKMMTVVAIMAGLLPIMWGTGTGSEVMSRIAAPMVGGMISSTVLTLAVIPAIYALVKQRRLKRGME